MPYYQTYPDIALTDLLSDSRQKILDRDNAIRTFFAGLVEPVVMIAGQAWLDLTTLYIKVRNATNTDWIAVGKFSEDWGCLLEAGGTMTGKIILDDDPTEVLHAVTKQYADTKISKTTAGEIAAMTEKVTPVDADLVVIEDSADGNTKKKVQVGNLPGGSGVFVPIDCAALHFNTAYFTTDGAWHVDGLDLTALVPAGAIAVSMGFSITDDAVGSMISIRRSATNSFNSMLLYTMVANQASLLAAVIPIDADRKLDYYFSNVAFVDISMQIQGYFI